jgi:hypothetical protein
MNRTDAVRELEQTIEWMMATFFEGRCPRCEAMAFSDETIMLATRHPGGEGDQNVRDAERIPHAQDCPCRPETFFERAGYLCERFGLEVEFDSESRGDKAYYGPRFVRHRGHVRAPDGLFLIGADRYTYLSNDGTWHESTGENLP